MNDSDLNYIQRVLESNAPDEDRERAAQMVRDIRRSHGQAPAVLDDKSHPRFIAGYDAGMADARRMVASAEPEKEDDSIALDKLADYIADTWPMDKKYSLEEICQRLHAMWPGEFLSAAELEKNEPNIREALRALLLWWGRFQASDGNQQDAYNILVKSARPAWKFASVEFERAAPVAAQAPAANGDALRADPLQGAANWLVKALAKPRPTEIAARLLIGYTRASRLYYAAMQRTTGSEE